MMKRWVGRIHKPFCLGKVNLKVIVWQEMSVRHAEMRAAIVGSSEWNWR